PPPARASSALTGTARASGTLRVTAVTVTVAWSVLPVSAGRVGFTVTMTVGVSVPDPPEPDLSATLLTDATTPGVVWWSGMVMVTWSPALNTDCSAAFSSMVTTRPVELASSTPPPGDAPAPRMTDTLVIRATDGRKTAWPNARVPVWSTPTA